MRKNRILSDQHRKNSFTPKSNNDKRTLIVAWVLIVLIGFCTVCSFLTLGLTFKDCVQAKADEVKTNSVLFPGFKEVYWRVSKTANKYKGAGYQNENIMNISLPIVKKPSNFTFDLCYIEFYYGEELLDTGLSYTSISYTDLYILGLKDNTSVFIKADQLTYNFTLKNGYLISKNYVPSVLDKVEYIGFYGSSDTQYFYNLGSFKVCNSKGYLYETGYQDGYDKGINEGIQANITQNYIYNYLKEWDCSVGYNDSLTNKGKFKLTSDNISIYASGYYPLIKNDKPDNTKSYFIYLKANKNSKKFAYGYKDLIYKGLPEYTAFAITINKNGLEYTTNCWLDKSGKLKSLEPSWNSGEYEDNTYMTDIVIETRIVEIQNNTTEILKEIYNLQNYPNLTITADEDIIISSSYQNGYNTAKDYYYNLWYLNRYEQGRQAGVEAAGKYTWLGLFGSIVDAPITALRGLLNFDLLGFNMFNAFSALVTLAIIIAIIRMVL